MNRITETFKRCEAEGRKALVMFVSAGCPDLETSRKLTERIIDAGADIIELGVPFSDPVADGTTIQEASQKALDNGATLDDIMAMAEKIRKNYSAPLVIFSYYNVILSYGLEKLAADCERIGIDGLLAVDVPLEESAEIKPTLEKHGVSLIPLVAPTTPPERAAAIVKDATGFVYYITVKGVTGARTGYSEDPAQRLDRLKAVSPVPVVAGFGISSPEMAAATAKHADGIVVGSALVKITLQDKPGDEIINEGAQFVAGLANALKTGRP